MNIPAMKKQKRYYGRTSPLSAKELFSAERILASAEFLREMESPELLLRRHRVLHSEPAAGNTLVREQPVVYAPRYIDPLTDWGFKYLFGKETGKHILIGFLNALFEGKKVIRDLSYRTTEHHGAIKKTRKVIFDLLCTTENGEQFIVEVQRNEQEYFKERAVLYNSRLISEQLPPGKESREYPLKDVCFIGLLDFSLPDTPSEEYLHEVCLMYKNTCKVFCTKQKYVFIELVKFNKLEKELVTDLEKWFYLFTNLGHMTQRPVCMYEPLFQEAFQLAEIGNLTKEKLQMYQSSLQDQYDYESATALLAKRAKEEGQKTGEHKKALETAIVMKMDGVPVPVISRYTRLSKEEVEKL